MEIKKTNFEELWIIIPDVYTDDRGCFFESYNYDKYKKIGIKENFVQDNQSISNKNVIRGLHYQIPPYAQGKLVRVIRGKILDVAVDIRFGSPTLGKYYSIELSGKNNLQLWIPQGFAHGFSTLEDNTIVQYKCTNFYSPAHERGIIFNDEKLNINWKITNPIVSKKDLNNITFKKINKDFIYEE